MHYAKHLRQNLTILLLDNIFHFQRHKGLSGCDMRKKNNESQLTLVIILKCEFQIVWSIMKTYWIITIQCHWNTFSQGFFISRIEFFTFAENGICKFSAYDYFDFPACFLLHFFPENLEKKMTTKKTRIFIPLLKEKKNFKSNKLK